MNSVVKYKSQQGAALLMFMLLLIIAASYALVRDLNSATKLYKREQTTISVLAEARQALISYAVSFPDRSGTVDLTAGPGYMSCPDTNNNGSPNTPCGPNAVGRFPGEFLGLNSYLDSSGERLWYAVSDNFRNIAAKFQPMNSDTPGQLTVDGIGDIVAVIIAPGEAVTGQNTRPSNNIADYLEGDNATTGDNSFTLNSGGNDILVYITRQELMSIIEKRVLAEVEDALNTYQASPNNNAYPWLAPFANPSTSAFRGLVDTRQGHIPYHWTADGDSVSQGGVVAGRNPFQTTVGWIWHTDPGTATTSNFPWGTLTPDCIRNVDCNDGFMPQLTQVTTPPVDCTWTNKDTVDCTSAGWVVVSTIVCDRGCGNFTCTREYNIDIPVYTGTANINSPTNLATRTRNVILNDLPVQNNAVEIRDRYTGNDPATACAFTITNQDIGGGSINFIASTTGSVEATIQYDLDIDDNELPEWFVANGWQNLTYIAYASGEPLPGSTVVGQDCATLLAPCLTVTKNGTPINNVRASVISAGADLNAARPSGLLTDYFDAVENTNVDDTFFKNRMTTTYNDQTRIISTAP